MTRNTRAKGKAGKEVMSRVGTTLWLLAIVLAADWGSAGGFQAPWEARDVSHGVARFASEARFARPAVLPRGVPRIGALETDRQKPVRGHFGKSPGINSEEVPLPLSAHHGSTPTLRAHAPWSAPFRAFEPRGPPRPIA